MLITFSNLYNKKYQRLLVNKYFKHNFKQLGKIDALETRAVRAIEMLIKNLEDLPWLGSSVGIRALIFFFFLIAAAGALNVNVKKEISSPARPCSFEEAMKGTKLILIYFP